MSRGAMAAAAGMIVAFFLPWAEFFGFRPSGFEFGEVGTLYGNLAWLVPGGALAVLGVGLSGRESWWLRAGVGLVPWIALAYGFSQMGTTVFRVLIYGAYAGLVCGAVLAGWPPMATAGRCRKEISPRE